MRSFGPTVTVNPATNAVEKVSCSYCIFRTWRDGSHACSHVDRTAPRYIDGNDPASTPDWCEMKAGAIRDATDMATGVEHYVVRWSGRKTDEPREIFGGIPSEAERQFRLASRDARRGTVQLEDRAGTVLASWPEPPAKHRIDVPVTTLAGGK